MKNRPLKLTQEWDKVFPQNPDVAHRKITFHNRYGITLAADLYKPNDAQGPLPAIAVSGPFGAVKEQASGRYAQELARRGFLTIAFDPSFTGESGGERRAKRAAVAAQRTRDYASDTYALAGGLPDERPEGPLFLQQYWDFYKTPRGYHPRSLNSNGGWNITSSYSFLNMPLLAYLADIDRAVMIVHGEKAHSRYFGQEAFEALTEVKGPEGDNKILEIVPGATHCDLYDQMDKIPFDHIEAFYREHL